MSIARDSSIIESLAYFKRVGQPIVAPATALGGPIAVLRISGVNLDHLKSFLGDFPPANSFCYRALKLKNSTESLDKVLLLYFKAPHSFTGEDVIEIQSHGVSSLIEKIQSEILLAGAQNALPGEFSFRAVKNAKMSLQDAEGLQSALSTDGISFQWASKLLSIDPQNESLVSDKIQYLLSQIRVARGGVEAVIDFPEAAEEQARDIERAESALLKVKSGLSDLLSSYYHFSKTAGEPRVVILGAPNAGKSTLLNSLIGSERSIVSNLAGTTRDVVEVRLKLPSGKWIRILDTAGLRDLHNCLDARALNTADLIENRGIQLGLEASDRANLIIWVKNLGEDQTPELNQIQNSLSLKTPMLLVNSHGDLFPKIDKKSYNLNTLDSIKKLEILCELDSILALDQERELKKDFNLVISRRQGQLIEACELEIDRALSSLRGFAPIEVCGDFLRESETLLCRLLGQGMGEAYIEEIFRQFCLGK